MPTYRKGKRYITKFMVNGKRETAMTATEEEGQAWELQSRAALKLGKPIPRPVGASERKTLGGRDVGTLGNALRSAINNHWSKMKVDPEKATANAKVFVRWVGENVPAKDSFTKDVIDRFVHYIKTERQVTSPTVNRYLSQINILSKHSHLDYELELPWEEPGESRKRFFEPEEERAIIALMSQWGEHRYLDLFMFLIDTGLRPWAEAARLPWENFARGQIFVPKKYSKNGKERYVPLTKRAKLVLDRQDRRQRGPFTDIKSQEATRFWLRVRKHLKMPDTVWYTARHTFASRLVMSGTYLFTVAQLMGNSEPIVATTYAHLSPNFMADAIEALDKYGQEAKSPKLTVVE